jgi:hypothetical protein
MGHRRKAKKVMQNRELCQNIKEGIMWSRNENPMVRENELQRGPMKALWAEKKDGERRRSGLDEARLENLRAP